MKSFMYLAIFAIVATANGYEIIEDEVGQQYYAVPIPNSREKRQTKWGLSNSGVGISHTANILDNNKHRLDGTASAAKSWQSHGLRPDQIGGRLDYNYKPASSSVFVAADRTRNWGTDVNAGVKYNIHQSKNWGADLTGQYGRHFGGPMGTGKPNAGVFLNVNGRF